MSGIRGKRDKKELPENPNKGWLRPETKKSAVAILLLGLTIVLLLARFGKAGPAGDFIYLGVARLLGWGYYLIPFIFLLIAFLFFLSHQKKLIGITFLGAGLFVISGLGFIDIVFPERGGLLGNLVGVLEIPFGRTASLVLASTFVLASLLITINMPIKIRKKSVVDVLTQPPVITSAEEIKISHNIEPAEVERSAVAKTSPMKKDGPLEKSDPQIQLKTNLRKLKSGDYVTPPLSLLKSSIEKPTAGDLRANANIIRRTLESFGIPVDMGEISIGPKVTRYTLKPAEGIKLARITVLNQDLSLALAAHPIRIEAPIPGKSLVGIEVPNKSAAIVRLGSLLAYQDFTNSGPLTFVLGRDVGGELVMADMEKMPHLLVAGSTGSGKSVCIHSMIVSLLYKNSPEILKLILIDPKKVELSVYEGIPHLVAPVITDGKKAIGVFRWAIQEMEQRYETLLKAGARDIRSYNKLNDPPLPYLILVIDELADLMAAYGREIESSVVRLAQMARATGIHLVVSTQRPSVEVITGLIKANITSRVALQVASQVDSRTILDTSGAEKLLGGGDMLFVSYEFSKPKRVQGAYIPEEEIQKVAQFVKENNEPKPEAEELLTSPSFSASSPFDELSDNDIDDQLYTEAVRIVREAKKASASLLQRHLRIGYARAARLLDIMESKGLVGPVDGAKPREIFDATGEELDENQRV